MQSDETEWQRLGDGFWGFGGHSAYQEVPEVISRGAWRLCTPSLASTRIIIIMGKYLLNSLHGTS